MLEITLGMCHFYELAVQLPENAVLLLPGRATPLVFLCSPWKRLLNTVRLCSFADISVVISQRCPLMVTHPKTTTP